MHQENKPGSLIDQFFSEFPTVDRDFVSLRREFDRFLDTARNMARLKFAADLYEKDGKYVLDISAPGFSKDELSITVSGNTLTLTGEHKTEEKRDDKRYHYREIQRGHLYRSVTLPSDIDESTVNAELKNGVLTVTATPTKPAAAKKIEIRG
ncbi:MAG: Hsp20/alpha crystallin family protein [Vulcanimicrobiaceae bacterium]